MSSSPVRAPTFSNIILSLMMARAYIEMGEKRFQVRDGLVVTMGAGTGEAGVQSLLKQGEKGMLLKQIYLGN